MKTFSILQKLWDGFWYQETSAEGLGLFRIIFFTFCIVYALQSPGNYSFQMDSAFIHKTFFFELLRLPLLDFNLIKIIQGINLIALFLCLIGFATSLSTVISFLLSFYIYGFDKNFGFYHHADSVFVLSLLIMSLSSCGHRLSIDSLIKNRIKWPFRIHQSFRGEYFWPLQALKLLWVYIFFSAVLFKLRLGGLDWITGDILAVLIRRFESLYGSRSGSNLLLSVQARNIVLTTPYLTYVLTYFALILELLMPLALVSKKFLFLVPLSFLMIFLSYFILGHTFLFTMAPLLFAWLNYEKILKFVRKKFPQGDKIAY